MDTESDDKIMPIITGTLLNFDSTALEGQSVKARLVAPVTGTLTYLPGQIVAATNVSGEFSLSLPNNSSFILSIPYLPALNETAKYVDYVCAVTTLDVDYSTAIVDQ